MAAVREGTIKRRREVQVSESIVYLADVLAHRQGWSKPELAHFRRAINLLFEAGLLIETASGLTDEGEPWFVFCDASSGDVLAHFAKINGKNVVCAPLLNSALTARILPDLVERVVGRRARRRSSSAIGRSTPAA
jgi:hypothetical protein